MNKVGKDYLVRGRPQRPPFRNLVSHFGSELDVLVEAQVADIAAVGDEKTAEGVARVRAGDISIEPGYDGRYGAVKVL